MFVNINYFSEVSDEFFHSTTTDFWIGLTRLISHPSWTWTDGSGLDFAKWKQQSLENNTGKNCAALSLKKGLWTPKNCYKEKPYVCKVAGSGNPSPTSPVTPRISTLLSTTASPRISTATSTSTIEPSSQIVAYCDKVHLFGNLADPSNYVTSVYNYSLDASMSVMDNFTTLITFDNFSHWSQNDTRFYQNRPLRYNLNGNYKGPFIECPSIDGPCHISHKNGPGLYLQLPIHMDGESDHDVFTPVFGSYLFDRGMIFEDRGYPFDERNMPCQEMHLSSTDGLLLKRYCCTHYKYVEVEKQEGRLKSLVCFHDPCISSFQLLTSIPVESRIRNFESRRLVSSRHFGI